MTSDLVQSNVRAVIDRLASQTPDNLFLVDPTADRKISYAELKTSCVAVTNRLAELGIKRGQSVGYAMTNGADAALVILGCLYGGYLATAINLVSGKSTIGYVLEHSEAKAVICQQHTKSLLDEAAPNSAAMFIDVADISFLDDLEVATSAPKSTDDGLLMYTSGTTGVPKGVVLSQSSLLAGGENTAIAHGLTSSDRGLCVLPLYHINGLCVTLLGTLVSGSSLVLPQKFSVSEFWNHLRKQTGTWFSVVPTQISYLLNEAETNGHSMEGLEQLRFGRSASAPLSPDVQQAFESKFGVPVIETMGLTETAAQILSNPIDGIRKIGSPGIAYGNEVQIGDEAQAEVPRGQEGEVLVRGPNVMKGYLKNPDETAKSITSEGWLRTGDLGRMDEDGYVYITGRLKELIIKGGENIAPREIDDALYSHPDVIEAAAFARDCPQYGQRVEAGVKLREGSILTQTDLRNLCEEKLGAFKSPDFFHVFPELPKGPSGKIQRLKLAELTEQKASA